MTPLDLGARGLPYGAFSTSSSTDRRLGAALGDSIIDLRALAGSGALGDGGRLVEGPDLHPLLEAGRRRWSELRSSLQAAIRNGHHQAHLVDASAATMHLP